MREKRNCQKKKKIQAENLKGGDYLWGGGS